MDYFTLLNKAQKLARQEATKDVPCYTTSFSPPKKVDRGNVSSDSIKRFLAKKEEEEKKKMLEAKKKKEELLALRALDKKSQKRMQIMLKTTKSANKSVMEDAIDNVNTADTLNGTKQCDEDDYGYVSQEASALYEKLMSKYQSTPAESKTFKREVKDLDAAKDRVKAALRREEEEELLPRKRKRKHKDTDKELSDGEGDVEEEEEPKPEVVEEVKKEEKKKVPKNAPPPVDFFQLLKIAEQKQHEPIIIEKKVEKEPERPMTMREKMEHQREMERKMRKSNPSSNSNRPEQPSSSSKPDGKPSFGRIPKKPKPEEDGNSNSSRDSKKSESSVRDSDKKPNKKSVDFKLEEKSKKLFGTIPKKREDAPSPKLSNGKSECRPSSSKLHSDRGSSLHSDRGSSLHSDRGSSSSSKPSIEEDKKQELSDIDKEIEMLMRKKAMMMAKAKEGNRQNGIGPPKSGENKKPDPLRMSEGKRPDPSRIDGKRPDPSRIDGKRPDPLRTDGKRPEASRSSDVRRPEGKSGDPRRPDRYPDEARRPESRPGDARRLDNRLEGVRRPSGKPMEGKKPDSCKPTDGRRPEGRPSEIRKGEPPRPVDGRRPEMAKSVNGKRPEHPSPSKRPLPFDGKPYDPASRFPMKQRSPPGKKPNAKKRVIDSESEYDSDLDGFIDDGPEDEMDYSRHIKEIFGYDKSRYSQIDEDECEESSFVRQMIEEKRSAKIGLLEDLEDIQREKEEKERAMQRKKMKMKR